MKERRLRVGACVARHRDVRVVGCGLDLRSRSLGRRGAERGRDLLVEIRDVLCPGAGLCFERSARRSSRPADRRRRAFRSARSRALTDCSHADAAMHDRRFVGEGRDGEQCGGGCGNERTRGAWGLLVVAPPQRWPDGHPPPRSGGGSAANAVINSASRAVPALRAEDDVIPLRAGTTTHRRKPAAAWP